MAMVAYGGLEPQLPAYETGQEPSPVASAMVVVEGVEPPKVSRLLYRQLPLPMGYTTMVLTEGFEPPTQRASTACSTGLNYVRMLAPSAGFEPASRRLTAAYNALIPRWNANVYALTGPTLPSRLLGQFAPVEREYWSRYRDSNPEH